MYDLDFSVLLENYKIILNGIYITVLISVIASFFAFCIGSIFVYFRTSPIKYLRNSTNFFIGCIRNTPLLIIIYLFYKGFPSIGIVFSAIVCGIMSLSIYTGSYISDALLSGINAVPQENIQAAQALGLNRFQTFYYIIYPQSIKHSIFILGSQFMNLVKNSSLVSFIAVADIFYVTYKGIADSYRIYEYFILAIVIYCSLTGIVLWITNLFKKRYQLSVQEVRV